MFSSATIWKRVMSAFAPARFEIRPAFASENLFDRLRQHVDEFELVRNAHARGSQPWQDTPAGQRLKAQALELAANIAALPGFAGNPVLCESHRRIERYWRSKWSCGGVTDVAYRVALKSIMVYIQERPAWPYSATNRHVA